MQRRNSTKSRGINRRKSTTSIKSVQLVHIHPGTAERDAQVAASQAFARARDRSATDITMWPPPRGNERPGTGCHARTVNGCSNGHIVRRQQSVRFVNPTSTHDQVGCAAIDEYTPSRPATKAKFRVLANSNETCPPNSASAAGMVSAAKGAAGDYINALIRVDEYYTPEDDIASAPSSYRRLRKSKSMFTTSEFSRTEVNQQDHHSSVVTQYLPRSKSYLPSLPADENMPPAELRAPKSMSFLRSRHEQSDLHSVRRGSAPMTAISKEDMRSTTGRGRLKKSQSSMLFRPKSTNPEKVFRKSLRDVSNGTMSAGPKFPKDGTLRNKARKASHNFKHKLKSFFSFGKGENDDIVLPPQQVKAHKTHVVEIERPDAIIEDIFLDDAALSRVTSGVPSLHAVPSNQQLRSRQGSLESLRSDRRVSDEQSRVTSWTNSDTNTLATINSQRGEWERQRLSVIKENGSHISSLTRRPAVNTIWTTPNETVNVLSTDNPELSPKIDGQRIYSALMKRVGNSRNPNQSIDMKRQKSVEDFVVQGVVPKRNSSRDRNTDGRCAPSTIRHVLPGCTSESRTPSAVSKSTTADELRQPSDPGTTASNMTTRKGEASDRPRSSLSVNAAMFPMCQDKTSNGLSTLSTRSMTSPHIGDHLQPARILSSRSSAFFGSPTCHLFRTQSPYRRAIQGSMKATVDAATPKSPEFNPWVRSLNNLPIRCPSTCESEVDKKTAYTESVYSCDHVEHANGSNNTFSLIEKFPDPPTNHGDATIFLDPPCYLSSTPLVIPDCRVASSASSVEWKSWLSANVSKLEQSTLSIEPSGTSADQGILPKYPRGVGHVRESAQIGDEEGKQEVSKQSEPSTTDCAVHSAQPNADPPSHSPRPVLKNICFTPFADKENAFPTTPPVPPKSALRPAPSMQSIRSIRGMCRTPFDGHEMEACDTVLRKSLSHARSMNALSTIMQNGASTTTKLVKRQPRPKSCATPLPSPGIGAAIDRQFGKLGGSMDSTRRLTMAGHIKSENISPGAAIEDNPYGISDSGVLGQDTDLKTPVMGSKCMVDLFLNSRRKRILGSEDENAFL